MAESYFNLVGKTFNSLTFIFPTKSSSGKMRGMFRCRCGKEVELRISSVKSGNTKSCGCMRHDPSKRRIVLREGERYGMLTIISEADRYVGNPNRRVVAKCDCGTIKEYFLFELRAGGTKSCGCIKHDFPAAKTHGHTSKRKFSPEYYSWASMKTRCTNRNAFSWRYYGARGIIVCDRWLNSFENFLADMGPRPDGTSLDRWPNPSGNYEPGNCRWATDLDQANNKTSNDLIEYEGIRKSIAEWARECGLPYNTLFARLIRLKWDTDRALNTPSR